MLRRLLISAASVALLSTAAQAADLPAYEAAPSVAVPSFTWTGAYVGVQAGYAWGRARTHDDIDGDFNQHPKGFIVGGYAGYNYQFDGSPVVIGVETDFNYADINDSDVANSSRYKPTTRWTGATRARLGYAFDRFLVYGAAGVAYEQRKLSVSAGGDTLSDKKTGIGWTVGGGVEYAATDNILVRAEYRYTDFGSDKYSNFLSNLAGKTHEKNTEHRIMAGVAYKFSW